MYDDEEEFAEKASGHRVCKGIQHLHKGPGGHWYGAPPPVSAFLTDASGYIATLWTGPGFWCPLHEATDDDATGG
jgi:hypothetical protein